MVNGEQCFETNQVALNLVARLGVIDLSKIFSPTDLSRQEAEKLHFQGLKFCLH